MQVQHNIFSTIESRFSVAFFFSFFSCFFFGVIFCYFVIFFQSSPSGWIEVFQGRRGLHMAIYTELDGTTSTATTKISTIPVNKQITVQKSLYRRLNFPLRCLFNTTPTDAKSCDERRVECSTQHPEPRQYRPPVVVDPALPVRRRYFERYQVGVPYCK